jgi:hypothetical protein
MADWILSVERVGVAVVLLLSLAGAFCRFEAVNRAVRAAARFGRHPRLAALSVGLLAGGLAMAISLIRPPAPIGHDEQSYLLAADTFSHGRVANPTHPMWVHFETFHVIHRPTYASKYPPAQGMTLALGQVVAGSPLVGVWISTALAAAAMCWMMQGWLPGRWALLGGGIVALNVAIQLAWGQSYWGGNVAMIGGALLFGSLPRLWRKPQSCPAAMMACGLVILANSRPYEGLVASLPVALALLVRFFGTKRPPLGTVLTKAVLPLAILLSVAAGAMAYYNLRVTGSPWKMPYQVYQETYAVAPVFLWHSPRPEPTYRHPLQRWMHTEGEMGAFRYQQSLSGLVKYKAIIVGYLLHFFLRPTLTVPLFALPWILSKPSMRFVAATLAFAVAGSLQTTWVLPHYLAPVMPLLFVLVVQGIRRLRRWTWDGKPCGRSAVFGLAVLYVLVFILSVYHYATVQRTGIARYRPPLVAQLERLAGKHLVVVRYGAEHFKTINDEWVYNAADIDAAKIVWARDMGPARNRELLDYFQDRRLWLLLADEKPPRLLPYPEKQDRGQGSGDRGSGEG